MRKLWIDILWVAALGGVSLTTESNAGATLTPFVAVSVGEYLSNGQVTTNCGLPPPNTTFYGEAWAYDDAGTVLCQATALAISAADVGPAPDYQFGVSESYARCQPPAAGHTLKNYDPRITTRTASNLHLNSTLAQPQFKTTFPASPGSNSSPVLKYVLPGTSGTCAGSYMEVAAYGNYFSD